MRTVVLGGEVDECRQCHGEGYYEVGSSIDPEENEWVECEECGASGVVVAGADDEEVVDF